MIKLTILALAFAVSASAQLNDVQRQDFPFVNIIQNAGFENGRAKWTASGGTFAAVTSGSNLLDGRGSVTWDSSASSQTLTSTAVAIPRGLYGRTGLAQCLIQTPSGTATHTIQAFDGTNILASQTVTSSTTPSIARVNFIFPTSGNIQLRLVSVASNEPLIAIDDCYVGEPVNLTSVAQSTLVGSAFFAGTALCSGWTRTNTAFGAFATDTDCPGPTVEFNPGPGTIQTTDADLPQVTINNLPPGIYTVEMTARVTLGSGSAVQNLAISDGTTTSYTAAQVEGTQNPKFTVTGNFSYTSTGNRTFQLFGASSSSSIAILNDNTTLDRVTFRIFRSPLAADMALSVGTSAASWSGYHDSTCNWTRANTSFGDFTADASCALGETTNTGFGSVTASGSTLPAITFTPSSAGSYLVCANMSSIAEPGGGSANLSLQMIDNASVVMGQTSVRTDAFGVGATICGITNVASVSAQTIKIQGRASTGSVAINHSATTGYAISWTVARINQQTPAPLILDTNVTPGANGVIDTFLVSFGGATLTTACSASPCATIDQIGSAVTSITRSGSASYAVNTARTYSKLKCTGSGGNGSNFLSIGGTTSSMTCSNCSSLPFQTGTGATAADGFGTLTCQGLR